MKVLFAASEATPFVKTGGLADVIGLLPKALVKSGKVEVFVALPKYGCIDPAGRNIVPTGFGANVPVNGHTEWAEVWRCVEEPNVFFICNPRYFDRPHPYEENGWGYPDNAERFIFFSRAVLEICSKLDFWPDVLHCNDWHTALAPVFLNATDYFSASRARVATVLTVHNAGYQGRFGREQFWQTGLPSHLLDHSMGLEHGYGINFLKGGVLYSDAITTVSPRYGEEIKSSPGGSGLENVFSLRADSLFGILNGIDMDEWNPATDLYLAQRYNAFDLSGKLSCKRHAQFHLGLPVRDDVPLIASIMRLSDQKGIHLVDAVTGALEHTEAQFVLVGAGHPAAEDRARSLAHRFPTKFSAVVGSPLAYDPSVVHQVEAAADIFALPSIYEPCGLNQMYSMRYGAVPVVRATGGLDDTVREYDSLTGEGNGFKFYDPTTAAFGEALARALYFYRDRKDDWLRIVRNGMSSNFSWDAAASLYLQLYEYILSRRRITQVS
ncbi:MAG: glycogen synthase [Candidatus Lindowbacteria bacterium]|nr:glycogen synthase [Candidatus Lindowbacteria bacterium]